MNAQEKLAKAKEQLELLRSNLENYSISEQLTLANTIKKHLVNDECICADCISNDEIAKQRERLLDEISSFQVAIINVNTKIVNFDNEKEGDYFFDFKNAKSKLIELITNEIQQNQEWENNRLETTSLIKNFEDYNLFLKATLQKLQKDKYSILLLAKSQTGKTTTINALCDGQEVGVIGRGDATTSVPTIISYGETPSFYPIWKNEEDIQKSIFSLVKNMPGLMRVHLDDEEARNSLLRDIENTRKNKSYSAHFTPDDSKFFAYASIVLKFWNSIELNKLKEKTFTTRDVLRMTVFPQERTNRKWENGGVSDLKFDDYIFLFLKAINIQIPSETLKNINGEIIDCPGLFSSTYDTKITESMMVNADAIFVILPRESSIKGDADEMYNALLKIKSNYTDVQRKLIFANNIDHLNVNHATTIASNKRCVEDIFGSAQTFVEYDAILALYEQLKMSFDNGQLDDSIIQEFVNNHPHRKRGLSTPSVDFNDALEQALKPYRCSDDEWDLNDSNFTVLLSTIQSFIEENKAYSLIITNGLNKIEQQLEYIRTKLFEEYVQPYWEGEEKTRNRWTNRKSIAEKFNCTTQRLLHQTLFEETNQKGQTLEKLLTDEIFPRVFPSTFFDALNDTIASRIYAEIGEIKKLRKEEEKLKEYMTNLVSDCINSMIKERLMYWNDLIASGQDQCFNIFFTPAMKTLKEKLLREWDNISGNDRDFKLENYFHVSATIDSNFTEGKTINGTTTINKKDITAVIALNVAAWATLISGFVAAYALYLVACVATGPIGWLIGGITTLAASIWGTGSIEEYNERKFKKKILPELKQQLNGSGLSSQLKKMVKDNIVATLTKYENSTKFDFAQFDTDMANAIHSSQDPDSEVKCFNAVDAIGVFNDKIEKFEMFRSILKEKV